MAIRLSPSPNLVFEIARVKDPFITNPYLLALLDLPPIERKVIARQVVILCAAIDGITPEDALELLAAISPYLGGDR